MGTAPLNDQLLHSMARELAMDFFPVEEILDRHGVTPTQFENIKATPYFDSILREAVRQWNSATNARERAQLRMATLVELSLDEMWLRLVDSKETLAAKVTLLQTLMKGAKIGVPTPEEKEGAVVGERVSITINMGADAPPMRVVHNARPSINHDGDECGQISDSTRPPR